ncbi:hypothetical protein RFI_17907 [Reticulomyxa filosa]|uniref:Uncharacterized protein n=1 Tax=Reticulomyxa filosa TaxID=46433 RepID=X6MZ55_RETFI|nr:hypothetical protein RFI_17907 [Reticulomyxa filosa]|eukprot:ETO19325.1 hypothetical protein RFI_17907 [Reticulomyxa filosa]
MLEMVAILVCSCVPPKYRKELETFLKEHVGSEQAMQRTTTDLFQQYYSYIYNQFGYQLFAPNLPETTLVHSNMLLTLPNSDVKTLSSPGIWSRFLTQNPHAVSRIVCHLSWMNKEFSKKCVNMLVKYLETVKYCFVYLLVKFSIILLIQRDESQYTPCYIILRDFLKLKDYKESFEEQTDENKNQETAKYDIRAYSAIRVDRFLSQIIPIIENWVMKEEYSGAVQSCCQFVDEMIRENPLCAVYFRNRQEVPVIKWYRKFVSTRSFCHYNEHTDDLFTFKTNCLRLLRGRKFYVQKMKICIMFLLLLFFYKNFDSLYHCLIP